MLQIHFLYCRVLSESNFLYVLFQLYHSPKPLQIALLVAKATLSGQKLHSAKQPLDVANYSVYSKNTFILSEDISQDTCSLVVQVEVLKVKTDNSMLYILSLQFSLMCLYCL